MMLSKRGHSMSIPYAEALGGEDAQKVIGATPQRLAKIYDGLTADQIEHHPAPGKWNLRELMAHLADCEIVWAWRLRFVFEQDRGQIQPFDQTSWGKMYTQYTLEAARATFNSVRAWNVAFVEGLTQDERRKPYVHPERGEETLWNIVEIMAGHDLHHLKMLEAAHISG